jgi:hypothetical protein
MQCVHDSAVEQAKIADGLRDVGVSQLEEAEKVCRAALEHRLALSARAHAIHHVGAATPSARPSRDDLGRILKIRVNDHHRITARCIEPGSQRKLVPEVARQCDHADVGVLVGDRARAIVSSTPPSLMKMMVTWASTMARASRAAAGASAR